MVAMTSTQRMAECHPDRPYRAKGLCNSCYVKQWTREHPDADTGNNWLRKRPERQRELNRKYHLLHKHGATVEQYEEAWHAQGGRCANPRCDFTAPLDPGDYRKGLVVDHNHRTGRFRALLCNPCNRALGHALEDEERLLGLVEYLAKYGDN